METNESDTNNEVGDAFDTSSALMPPSMVSIPEHNETETAPATEIADGDDVMVEPSSSNSKPNSPSRGRGVSRTPSNMSTDSKPDPPCRGEDHELVIRTNASSTRGIDVRAKHRHHDSVHQQELQSQQYFVNVPSKDDDAEEEDDEEMTQDQDLNEDSQQALSLLLEAVEQVEDPDRSAVTEDDARQAAVNDRSSMKSISRPGSSLLVSNTDDVLSTTPNNEAGINSNNAARRLSNYPGPDTDVILLPPVDENMAQRMPHPLQQHGSSVFGYSHTQGFANQSSQSLHSADVLMGNHVALSNSNNHIHRPSIVSNGRRKMRLRLQEVAQPERKRSILGHLRNRSRRMMFGSSGSQDVFAAAVLNDDEIKTIDRGSVLVSWFEGTSTTELQEHVRKTVLRKLDLDRNVDMADFRIFDESVQPPEEVLLCPFIPDGSEFVLRFTTQQNDGASTPLSIYSGRAPDSPSSAPSPGPNNLLAGLNAKQLALLRKQLNNLALPKETPQQRTKKYNSDRKSRRQSGYSESLLGPRNSGSSDEADEKKEGAEKAKNQTSRAKEGDDQSLRSNRSKPKAQSMPIDDESVSDEEEEDDDMLLHSGDPIEARLLQITEMLLEDRNKKGRRSSRRKADKRQVIFVLANYFVLFLSAIAIFAEIQGRLPSWQAAIESHLTNVQDCVADKDALFKCVESGDFAGLSAAIVLYLSRSVATRRFFLLGFDSPKKLWTVVYEALVTSFCWGCSYLFIRRGMNPDTRDRFLHKYWKDAVYGSLAGFNAAFMKAVLKNLLPQEVVEDALRDRQLKILTWLPSFS